MEELRLDEMSDDRVLERVEVLVARSNRLTAELLAYLNEVERRGLHLRKATSSLFVFCVERLHMSESAAGKRITAARTARRFPVIFEMLAQSEIHLTAVTLLAPHLTEENAAELLASARHQSKRAIEKLIAEVAPQPDLPSRVVALPRRPPEPPAAPALLPDGPRIEHAPERVAKSPERQAAVVAPLAPRRYQIRLTVGEETHAALTQLQDLLAHQVPDRDPAVIIARALDLLLERTLARKAAVTGRPREAKGPEKRTRHIPAAVRRAVWKRDTGQCAFVDDSGRRCASTRFLEFHHRANWGRGAEHEPDEMELRCRAHNQYQAVLDYGAEFMSAKRSRAEEPRPAYAGSAADRSRGRERAGGERARSRASGGLRGGVAEVLPSEARDANGGSSEHVRPEGGA